MSSASMGRGRGCPTFAPGQVTAEGARGCEPVSSCVAADPACESCTNTGVSCSCTAAASRLRPSTSPSLAMDAWRAVARPSSQTK